MSNREGSLINRIRSGKSAKFPVFVDISDPDNLCFWLWTIKLYGLKNVALVLTGRCAHSPEKIDEVKAKVSDLFPETDGDVSLTQQKFDELLPQSSWDPLYSRELLGLVAGHFVHCAELSGFLVSDLRVFDGGFPSGGAAISHMIHFREQRYLLPEEGIVLESLESLASWLADDPWMMLLGGPATAPMELLERNPRLWDTLQGMSAQFATLGKVDTMPIPGRSNPNVQFNIWMDRWAAYKLLQGMKRRSKPVLLAPTDLTRHPQLAIPHHALLSAIFDTSTGAGRKLIADHIAWAQDALYARGEAIRTHDANALLLLFQLLNDGPEFYRVRIGDLEIVGPIDSEGQEDLRFGETNFRCDATPEDDNTLVAYEPNDVQQVFVWLNRLARMVPPERQMDVVLSASLLRVEMEPDSLTGLPNPIHQAFTEAIERRLRPLLEQGHRVHFRSHPSTFEVMGRLVKEFGGLIVQHIPALLMSDRSPEFAHVRLRVHPDMETLHYELTRRCDLLVVVGGPMIGAVEGEQQCGIADDVDGILAEIAFAIVHNSQVVVDPVVHFGHTAAMFSWSQTGIGYSLQAAAFRQRLGAYKDEAQARLWIAQYRGRVRQILANGGPLDIANPAEVLSLVNA